MNFTPFIIYFNNMYKECLISTIDLALALNKQHERVYSVAKAVLYDHEQLVRGFTGSKGKQYHIKPSEAIVIHDRLRMMDKQPKEKYKYAGYPQEVIPVKGHKPKPNHFTPQELLLQFDVPYGITTFNKKMMEAGFMEEVTATNTVGNEVKYKRLTSIEWGSNFYNERTPYINKMLYRENSFKKLVDILDNKA